MIQFKKIIILVLTSSLFLLPLIAEELPSGYKNIKLGSSLEDTKIALLKDSDFGYRGERDVSLVPGTGKILIETNTYSKFRTGFLEECYFQFFEDKLFIITININQEKMDYYSIFTKLQEKYGEPSSFDPKSATWENDDVSMSLEKPLTLKYIDKKLFDKIQNYSNINSSPEEKTQEMFLDEL